MSLNDVNAAFAVLQAILLPCFIYWCVDIVYTVCSEDGWKPARYELIVAIPCFVWLFREDTYTILGACMSWLIWNNVRVKFFPDFREPEQKKAPEPKPLSTPTPQPTIIYKTEPRPAYSPPPVITPVEQQKQREVVLTIQQAEAKTILENMDDLMCAIDKITIRRIKFDTQVINESSDPDEKHRLREYLLQRHQKMVQLYMGTLQQAADNQLKVLKHPILSQQESRELITLHDEVKVLVSEAKRIKEKQWN